MRLQKNIVQGVSGVFLAVLLIGVSAGTSYSQVTTDQTQEPAPIQMVEVDMFSREDADVVLTLHELIDLALEQSFSVFQLKQSFLQSSYSLESQRRQLRTRVDFSSTLPSISQGINPTFYTDQNGDPVIDYLRSSRTNMNANIRVSQPLITDGDVSINMRMSSNESWNELTGDRRVENRSLQPSLGISLTQPLFQYNQIKNALRNAELNFESLEATYTQDELSQINMITNAFYTLFQQQRSLENAAESFQFSDWTYTQGALKYQAGLIAEVEAMRLEVTKANDEDRLERAKNSHEQRMFAFNRQVGLPLETKVWVEFDDTTFVPIEVDVDRALELAFQNRADMRLQEINMEQAEMSLRNTVSRGRPDLQMSFGYDLVGTSTLTGLGYDDPWNKHLSAAFDSDNRSPNLNVGLSLSIPVFDWGRNQALVERQLASMAVTERRVEETEQNLKRDVINRVRAVEQERRSLEIQMANRAVSDRTYFIDRTRFDRGEITITELLQTQTQYKSTLDAYLSALIGYEQAKAGLKEITLWDWETNQPVVRRTIPPTAFSRER